MSEWLSRFYPLDIYQEALQRRRAVGTYMVSTFLLVGVLVALLIYLGEGLFGQGQTLDTLTLLRGALLIGVAAGAFTLTRRHQQGIGAMLILFAWFAFAFLLAISGEIDIFVGFAGILIGASLSALLLGEQTVFITLVVAIVYTFVTNAQPANLLSESNQFGRNILLVGLPLLLIHSVVNFALARNLRLVERQITANVEERGVRLAKTSADLVQRVLGARLALNTVLEETVRLVRDNFPQADDVQLFLVDRDRKNATLSATTNLIAQPQIGAQHVGVGSLSVIGRATISGQTIIVREGGEEQPYRRAAFLVGTATQLVIPLRVGSEIIGALDVQSRNPRAFPEEEVEAIETLANQIAIALDNARLFAEMQDKLSENRRLFEQTSAQLREIERLNRQLTGGAWTDYLSSMVKSPAFTVDLQSGRVEDAAENTPTLAEAIRRGQTVVRNLQQGKILTLPIAVRGQVIGAMEFELTPDQNLGSEQLTVLQQVVERLGLAIENIRLLDEAQRMAQREGMVNEITARMQAATSVEAVIAAATQSLADAFQSPSVAIRLGSPEETSMNGNVIDARFGSGD